MAVDRLHRHRRQHGWTCPQLHFLFLQYTRVYKFFFFFGDAWICARRRTDRDLESQRHEKVNGWIFSQSTTHHDLVSVIPDHEERERRTREQEKNANL